MDKKTTGIVSFLTIIGFIVAVTAGDKDGARFHINQALVVQIFFVITNIIRIPFITHIINIFLIICWFIGLIAAINEEEKQMPLIGSITLIK